MNLLKSKRWVAIAIGMLSGSALAATINCTVTPANSVISAGGILQLAATCEGGPLKSINWMKDGVSLTGDVDLSGDTSRPINYTANIDLGASASDSIYTVEGIELTTGDAFGVSSSARVVIKPDVWNGTDPLDTNATAPAAALQNPAECGTTPGTVLQDMPNGAAQCASGSKAALVVSGPQAFTWSCLSLTGGAEASCYAVRGYAVTANVSGGNGTVSVANASVAAGGTTTVTATPASSSYSVATMTATGCSGTRADNVFTTGLIYANCNVTATFSNAPVAGLCGSTAASTTQPGQCTKGTFQEAVDSAGAFNWTCLGTNGGTPASCAAPKQYTVNATLSGTGGKVEAPTSKTVTHNAGATFAVTPDGTNVASVSGCGASVANNIVTTGVVTGPCTVTVSFGPAAGGISCNGVTMPGVVTEEVTGMSATSLARKTYAPASSEVVYAFKITVPQTTVKSVRSMSATKTTSSISGKRVVISACKGDYNPTGKVAGCYSLGTEVTTVKYAINYDASVAPTSKYCHLTPGNTYWVNVSSRSDPTLEPSCTSGSNCGFYFESN